MMDEQLSVLLIEDNEADATLIREMFADLDGGGIDLHWASDLKKGLRCVHENHLDAVLLDLSLKEEEGMDTFWTVHDHAPDLPIVVLTGLADEVMAVDAVKAGAQDYLVKGQVNGRLLGRSLRYAVERKKAEKDLKESIGKLRRVLFETVESLASAVETRDPYTAGHQRRVARLACDIAEEVGLADEKIDGLRVAAMVHDVGKIHVPAEILSKPGQLSSVEFGIIKMHPQIGGNILKSIEFPWPVARIVAQHHERMDGSGYDKGLEGEEILMEARILAVADVVEAMASHRPYRPSLDVEEALEEISDGQGVLYDEEVAEACLRLFQEKGYQL